MNKITNEADRRIQKALIDKSIFLDLSGLKLQAVPKSIGLLTQLRSLNLSNNHLQQLPIAICELVHLEELNLFYNHLQQLPAEIGGLAELRDLDLSNNQLKQLPSSIGQLSQLYGLNLTKNKLQQLPETIGKLLQLRNLVLSNNQLKQLPSSIGQLSQLYGLNLAKNKLQQLPASIGELALLQNLDLSDNLLKQLPVAIGELARLEDLCLFNNHLQQLPATIGELTQLRTLDLSNNQLQQLPDSLLNLKNLIGIYLHGNQLLNIPFEILGVFPQISLFHDPEPQVTSPASILDYYFRIQTAQRPLNEAKLILVGRGGVGKTSLVKKLLFNQFDEYEKKTEGIAISEWQVKLHESENIRINLWDFGGQEIMHATHQFFLTQRSLYLLVLEGRQGGEDADAEYWLKLIESFGTEEDGNSAPVIIVLNKSSLNPFDLNRLALLRKYPFIKGFLVTDCNTGQGIDKLRVSIEKEIDRLPYVRAAFPASWFAIKNQLATMKDNFISFVEYRNLCKQAGETECEGQDFLATHLHNLGVALNYKDDPRLRDTHVLNPRWVTSGVYALLNDPMLLEQKGELQLDDVCRILDQEKYPRHMHRFLMDLMRKFELCFTFADDDTHYLIPELLDKQEPKKASEFEIAKCLNFEYRYPVLPEGLLPRFIVRTHSLSEGTPRWRTGVILVFEGNRALVRADVEEKKVFIAVDGPSKSRRRLLAVIRSDFERIHTSISKLSPLEVVPLPGMPDVSVSYSELITFEQNGLKTLQKAYNGQIINLDVHQLLSGVDLDGTRIQYELNPDKLKVKIFYSYSHKDEEYRNKLETHLKILERTRVIDQWHDRNIEAGDEWKAAIDENLEHADIILLLVSSDFIASDYCWEKEMERALQLHRDGDATVIPIIIRDVNWKSAPFATLQALPKDAKAVGLWQNEDTAWRSISEGIEAVVKKRIKQ